jgi:hypothetical protein
MASERAKPAHAPQPPLARAGGSSRGRTGVGGGARSEVWVCGHQTLPLYVQRIEGGPFRPEFVAWVSPSGVLAASPAPPEELEQAVLRLLRHVLEHPLVGRRRRPSSVRVSDAGLVPLIEKALGSGVEIRVGATPEIGALVDQFINHLDKESPAPDADPWVGDGLDPEWVRGFFTTAAALYRAAPWKVVSDNATLFAVDAPALALKNACLSVVGGTGADHGFLLFDTVADYRAMRQKVMAIEGGGSPREVPWVPLFSVSFEPASEMPATTHAVIAQQNWPVAGPKAYPMLLLVEPDDAMRPPTGDDLVRAWALSEALRRLTRDHRGRLAGGAESPLCETYVLEGVPGHPEVTLTLPHPDDKKAPPRRKNAPKTAKTAKATKERATAKATTERATAKAAKTAKTARARATAKVAKASKAAAKATAVRATATAAMAAKTAKVVKTAKGAGVKRLGGGR